MPATLDFYVLHNGTVLYHDRSAQDVHYQFFIYLESGDSLEFLVGGGYNSGNTSVDVVITEYQP